MKFEVVFKFDKDDEVPDFVHRDRLEAWASQVAMAHFAPHKPKDYQGWYVRDVAKQPVQIRADEPRTTGDRAIVRVSLPGRDVVSVSTEVVRFHTEGDISDDILLHSAAIACIEARDRFTELAQRVQ